MKAQVLTDFINKLTPNSHNEKATRANKEWTLSVDKSSNKRGSGVGIIMEGPGGVLIEQSLHFRFQASNNLAEYEALLVGIQLANELGAKMLTVKSDSKLVSGQEQAETLEGFTLFHVPRKQNERAHLLAKLA
ncbi:hypothetical protein CR513_04950, partial [Mucuna pruriens]